MHVVMGGLNHPRSTAYHCAKALSKLCNLEVYDLSQSVDWKRFRTLNTKFPFGWPITLGKIYRQYPKMQAYFQIDENNRKHVWQGINNSLRRLRNRVPTALWAIDTHTPNGFFLKSIIKEFDTVFVAQKDYLDEYQRLHGNVFWLPLACEPSLHRNLNLTRDIDIVFVGAVGAVHINRRRLLERLAKRFKVLVFNQCFNEDMVKVFNRSKIVFNCSLRGDLNLRVFEAMGCGAFVLTDQIENGFNELFEPNRHIVTYKDYDLEDKVEYFLSHVKERESIAKQGQILVHEFHNYEVRMRSVLSALGKPFDTMDFGTEVK